MREKKILFIDFSTKLKSVIDLQYRARGGMVTSLFKVSDALSQFGHSVTVLSDIEAPGITQQGTKWITPGMFIEREYFDVLVANRGIGSGYYGINAKHRVLWTHDLPHNGFAKEPRVFKSFSRVVFMSRYAERVWRTFFKDIGKSVTIPNGVDKKLFRPLEKDHGRMVYISAPNRGLKRLPLIFEAIKYRVAGDVSMAAFSNMAKLHPNEVDDRDNDGFSLAYKSAADAGIEMNDPIPQKDLAGVLGEAGLMILPTDYPEICSNSILQSLACGTPVITTGNLGSAGEWVRHGWNGMLTKWHPVDYMVHTVEMVRNAVRVLESPRMHRKLIQNAAGSRILTWETVGEKWNRLMRRLR